MELQHKNKKWPKLEAASIFSDNFVTHDKFIASARHQTRIWMRVSFALGIIILALISTVIYLSGQPRLVPHVIEIAPWGEAHSSGVIGKNLPPDTIPRSTQSIHFYLREFLYNARSITTDTIALQKNLRKALDSTTQESYPKLVEEIQSRGIFIRAQNGRTEITIHTILQTTQHTYQIDWSEKSYNKQGEISEKRQFRGLFTLTFAQPSKKQMENNPLGIFINNYDITEIEEKEVKK